MSITDDFLFDAIPCSATALRKASRRVTQLYDEALSPSGLRSTQFMILAELERRARRFPTMRELADALVMDRSSLGHNLRPLERDGLVELEQSEEDRRRHLVTLTRLGKSRTRSARRYWLKAEEHFQSVFGEAQAHELRATLLGIARADHLEMLAK
jgi:DNA-binding MarR family transcriptional regulator